MHTSTRLVLLGIVLAATAALAAVPTATVPTAAAADDGAAAGTRNDCARTFDEAQRTDMESFRDFDRETWVAVHHPDAIAIFTDGTIVRGRDAIADYLRGHFRNRNAVWTWTELHRAVHGCRTATIVYDATYAVPSAGFELREIVSVTYTFTHGRWLSVVDQGTEIPAG